MTASAPLLGTEGYRPVDDLFTPRQVRKIRRLLKSFDLPDDHAFFSSEDGIGLPRQSDESECPVDDAVG